MKTAITVFLASTWLLAGFGVVSLVPLSLQLAHDVSQWEKANGYPYGLFSDDAKQTDLLDLTRGDRR